MTLTPCSTYYLTGKLERKADLDNNQCAGPLQTRGGHSTALNTGRDVRSLSSLTC